MSLPRRRVRAYQGLVQLAMDEAQDFARMYFEGRAELGLIYGNDSRYFIYMVRSCTAISSLTSHLQLPRFSRY